MRQFLDQLPRVISTKADPTRKTESDDLRQQQVVARALEATLHLRQATILYYSKSSERTKTYLVHPYRLAYAQGGLYLLAYVPEYSEVRTFATERIQEISAEDAPNIPIWEGDQVGAVRDGVEGVEDTFDPAFIFRWWLITKS